MKAVKPQSVIGSEPALEILFSVPWITSWLGGVRKSHVTVSKAIRDVQRGETGAHTHNCPQLGKHRGTGGCN